MIQCGRPVSVSHSGFIVTPVSPADSSVEVPRRDIRVSSRPVLQPQFALTMMVTGADQRTTVTLASRDGLPLTRLASFTCNGVYQLALTECMARRHASEAATTGSRARHVHKIIQGDSD